MESQICLIPDAITDYALNGRIRTRIGNRDDIMAPHGCYRCKGEHEWVTIAVATNEEWRALCQAIGYPELSGEDRFADGYRRYSNQEELDKLIGEWTINLSAYEVMNVLQKAGVAAAPSMSSKDLTEDPHLNERGFIVEWDHPVIGRQKHAGILWKTSKTLGMIYRHGPMVGEHNEYVFCELLGMPREELARLSEQGVVY